MTHCADSSEASSVRIRITLQSPCEDVCGGGARRADGTARRAPCPSRTDPSDGSAGARQWPLVIKSVPLTKPERGKLAPSWRGEAQGAAATRRQQQAARDKVEVSLREFVAERRDVLDAV